MIELSHKVRDLSRRIKRPYLIGGLTCAGIVILILLMSIFKHTKHEKIKMVSVVKVTRQNLSQEVTLSAEFQAFTQAILYAKVAGYLKKINVDIGDQVKKGDVLAVLEIPELESDVARDKAIFIQAQLEYNRISGINKKRPGLVIQDDIDKAKAANDVAKANYERARALLEYSTITAPYDGVITRRYVDEGAMIQAGASSDKQAIPVVEIADNKKLRLIFPVPESIVPQIKPGDIVDVTVQSPSKSFQAAISRIADLVNKTTRTMQTQVDVLNPDLIYTPGSYAIVKLHPREKKNVLALPIQAVDLGEKPMVWLVNTENKIEKHPVTLGLQTPDMVEVKSGVKEGDMAILGSRDALTPGMTVEPKLIEPPKFTGTGTG